jgi:hypothetical protein
MRITIITPTGLKAMRDYYEGRLARAEREESRALESFQRYYAHNMTEMLKFGTIRYTKAVSALRAAREDLERFNAGTRDHRADNITFNQAMDNAINEVLRQHGINV